MIGQDGACPRVSLAGLLYLVEVAAAPLGRMFASMSIKDGKEALATNAGKVNYERVGVFHGSPGALVL